MKPPLPQSTNHKPQCRMCRRGSRDAARVTRRVYFKQYLCWRAVEERREERGERDRRRNPVTRSGAVPAEKKKSYVALVVHNARNIGSHHTPATRSVVDGAQSSVFLPPSMLSTSMVKSSVAEGGIFHAGKPRLPYLQRSGRRRTTRPRQREGAGPQARRHVLEEGALWSKDACDPAPFVGGDAQLANLAELHCAAEMRGQYTV